MWRAWVLIVVAACGRFGFDPLADAVVDAPKDQALANDAPLACPPTAILCEDFEAVPVGWTTEIQGTGNAMRTTVRAHSGIGGLEAVVPPSGGSDRAALFRPALGTAPVVAARVWVYAIDPLVSYDHVLTWFGTPDNRFIAAGGDEFGNWVLSEGIATGGSVDHQSSTPAPVEVWTCVEIVRTHGTSTRVQLYIDDSQLFDHVIGDTSPFYDTIFVGLPRGDSAGAHVVIDDLVLSDRRIGCQ